jgi:hypothetical protein
MDTSIFGLRFKSNEALQPDAVNIAAFLSLPRTPGAKETHRDVFENFSHYQDLVAQSENGSYAGLGRQDFGERILLGVLSHTRFFQPALRIAIEEYLYHHHQLLQLDFNKPEKFIRSAMDELGRLNPKKREDQQKMARLQVMLDQRKADLESLTMQRRMLIGELCHIAAYVRDNIVKVQQLCEDSIASLARLQVGGKKTEQLIEDIKEHFKGEVRDRRQMGAVTPDYLETVKAEVAELSQLLKRQVLEDIFVVTGAYESFFEHAKRHAALLTDLTARAEQSRRNDKVRDDRVFTEIERVLITLVTECRPAMKPSARTEAAARHEDLLRDRRREMIDYVFILLKDQRKGDAWTV